MSEEFHYNFKCICIGDSGVGKTALLLRLTEGYFRESFITTIGVDIRVKTLNIFSKRIRLQLWDTAGQERFRTITSSYYRGADGIVLVYDISDRETFEACTVWMRDITKANPSAHIMLVGNKLDVLDREVSLEEAEDYARDLNIPYSETSAKSNTNVSETFRRLAVSLLNKKGYKGEENNSTNSVDLSKVDNDVENDKIDGGGCC